MLLTLFNVKVVLEIWKKNDNRDRQKKDERLNRQIEKRRHTSMLLVPFDVKGDKDMEKERQRKIGRTKKRDRDRGRDMKKRMIKRRICRY